MTEADGPEIKAVTLGPGEGRGVPDPMDFPMVMKAWSGATHGAYAMAEMMKPPGVGPTPHVHPDAEEAFYVLEGELEFKVSAGIFVAPAGSFVLVPRGVEHAFRNSGDTEARYLGIMSPPIRTTVRRPSVDGGETAV